MVTIHCLFHYNKPAIEREGQTLADTLSSAPYTFAVHKAIAYIRVYCHSNETRAPIANPSNSA